MSKKWLVSLDGQVKGPIDAEELEKLKSSGVINDTTLVWTAGFGEWIPLREVPRPARYGVAPDLNEGIESLQAFGSARRNFLGRALGMIAASATASIITVTVDPLKSVVNAFWGELVDGPAYDLNLLKALFGNLTTHTAFIPGTQHHMYRDRYHPDDYFAATTSHKVCENLLRDLEFHLDTARPTNLNGSALCAGEHVSNGLSRLVLEYEPIDFKDPSRGYKRVRYPIFEHRWEMVSDGERLVKNGISKSVDRGSGTIPNWSIYDHETERFIVPKLKDAELETDYLLITVLPNFFNREAYNNGHKIVTFGGTHGVGTRAMNLFLQNRDMMKKIANETMGQEAWQAIVRIDDIDKSQRWHPKSISLAASPARSQFSPRRINMSLDDAT